MSIALSRSSIRSYALALSRGRSAGLGRLRILLILIEPGGRLRHDDRFDFIEHNCPGFNEDPPDSQVERDVSVYRCDRQ